MNLEKLGLKMYQIDCSNRFHIFVPLSIKEGRLPLLFFVQSRHLKVMTFKCTCGAGSGYFDMNITSVLKFIYEMLFGKYLEEGY